LDWGFLLFYPSFGASPFFFFIVILGAIGSHAVAPNPHFAMVLRIKEGKVPIPDDLCHPDTKNMKTTKLVLSLSCMLCKPPLVFGFCCYIKTEPYTAGCRV